MCTIDRVNNIFDRVPNGNSNANGFHECGSVLWMLRERTEAEAAAIHTLVEKQDKGYDKYGQGIEHVDGYDWLAEAEEELADGMMYIAAAKLRRDDAFGIIDEIECCEITETVKQLLSKLRTLL